MAPWGLLGNGPDLGVIQVWRMLLPSEAGLLLIHLALTWMETPCSSKASRSGVPLPDAEDNTASITSVYEPSSGTFTN